MQPRTTVVQHKAGKIHTYVWRSRYQAKYIDGVIAGLELDMGQHGPGEIQIMLFLALSIVFVFTHSADS